MALQTVDEQFLFTNSGMGHVRCLRFSIQILMAGAFNRWKPHANRHQSINRERPSAGPADLGPAI